jgi:hypothetical protein
MTMKTVVLAIIFLLIGGLIGGYLGVGFGTGMGAGGGVAVGSQAGACLAMQTARDRGILSSAQVDAVIKDTVGKIKEDNITSRFKVQSIEPLGNQPWTYVAFGVKELHRIQQSIERTDRIVGRYTIRLIQERRSERNPSGLLLAEYKEEQMVGEKDSGLQQKSSLLDPQ